MNHFPISLQLPNLRYLTVRNLDESRPYREYIQVPSFSQPVNQSPPVYRSLCYLQLSWGPHTPFYWASAQMFPHLEMLEMMDSLLYDPNNEPRRYCTMCSSEVHCHWNEAMMLKSLRQFSSLLVVLFNNRVILPVDI